jgi:hypothetical protein
MRNTADVTGGKPIPVLLQSISGVSAINPLVAFYDVHGGKREVLFFYFVPDTTRDLCMIYINFIRVNKSCGWTIGPSRCYNRSDHMLVNGLACNAL